MVPGWPNSILFYKTVDEYHIYHLHASIFKIMDSFFFKTRLSICNKIRIFILFKNIKHINHYGFAQIITTRKIRCRITTNEPNWMILVPFERRESYLLKDIKIVKIGQTDV